MMKTRLIQTPDDKQSLPLLIKHLLHVAARQENEQQILYREKIEFTYKQFYERVCQLAHMLKRAGLKSGEAVAILDYNSHRVLECLFAVPMCGAVLHLVNTSLTVEQLAKAVNKNEDKLVILHPDFIPVMEKIAGDLESVQEFIIAADSQRVPQNTLDAYGEYEALLETELSKYDFPDFDDKSIAVATYKSQGEELKELLITHKEIVSNSLGYTASLEENEEQLVFQDTYMPLLPLCRSISTYEPYIVTLMAIKQVYPGRFDNEEVIKMAEMHQVTFSPVDEGLLKELFDVCLQKMQPSNNWRVILHEGNLSERLKKLAAKTGVKLYERRYVKEKFVKVKR